MRAAALVAAVSCLAVVPAFGQVPPPDGEIVWHRNTVCPGMANVWGCAYRPDQHNVVHIYIDPTVPREALDDVAWHEAGHAYDFLNMTDATRERWLAINRPRDNVQGWRDGINSPMEQFAESYRLCMLGRTAMPYRVYSYTPNRRTLRRTCKLLGGLH